MALGVKNLSAKAGVIRDVGLVLGSGRTLGRGMATLSNMERGAWWAIVHVDLLAIQGNLRSLLQHHRSKASILRCSAFFIAQLSYLYMTLKKPLL